jgi:streptomycin 6-kinase
MVESLFEPWLMRWRLTPDGEVISTPYSQLMPVLSGSYPAMLKIALTEEETCGGAVMEWFAGHGAAFVLAHEQEAVLMERASGFRSLSQMARGGYDGEATEAICRTVKRLHTPRERVPPATIVPLSRWFRALEPAASREGGILRHGAVTAQMLLAMPREQVVLHGDIHHENILDGGVRGWIAIDPKGLFGERAFDYTNIFLNPDLAFAASPGRLRAQAQIVAVEARIGLQRLLQWVLAYACLSASWTIEDRGDPRPTLAIAEIAAREATAA